MHHINQILLLLPDIIHFRNEYPEIVQRWEKQMATDSSHPDLYFCLVTLDGYPRLKAYLNSKEYLFDFVVNAHILYDTFMSRSVVNGYDEGQAVELANQGIRSAYRSRNDSPEIMWDPLAVVYFDLFENENGPV